MWLWSGRRVLCHDASADVLIHVGGAARADFVEGLFVVDRELWIAEADGRGATVRHQPRDASAPPQTVDVVLETPAADGVRLAATQRFIVIESKGAVGREDEGLERWVLDRTTARAARGPTGGVLDPVREVVVSSPGSSARLARFEIAPLGSASSLSSGWVSAGVAGHPRPT